MNLHGYYDSEDVWVPDPVVQAQAAATLDNNFKFKKVKPQQKFGDGDFESGVETDDELMMSMTEEMIEPVESNYYRGGGPAVNANTSMFNITKDVTMNVTLQAEENKNLLSG